MPYVANNLDLNNGVSILDIGCGAGAWIKVHSAHCTCFIYKTDSY